MAGPQTHQHTCLQSAKQRHGREFREYLQTRLRGAYGSVGCQDGVGAIAQRLLHQQFGQLLEQAVLANQVFRLLVDGQQAGQQFFGYVVFLGGHGAYGQAGLRRRWIGRLHKILHTLSYRYNHLMWGRSTFLTGYQEVSPFFESITTLWNFLSNVIDSFHAFERMVECNL